MYNYFFLAAALAAPFFIQNIKPGRYGLICGLFTGLFFAVRTVPLLTVAACIFTAAAFFKVQTVSKSSAVGPRPVFVRNPAIPVLIVFIVMMALFCSLESYFPLYGEYLGLDSHTLKASVEWGLIGSVLGPVFIGSRCDKKGPFWSCIFLALTAEASVLCIGAGGYHDSFYILGTFLGDAAFAGFFVSVPVLIRTFFGSRIFSRMYPAIASCALLVFVVTGILYQNKFASSSDPGSILMVMLVVTMSAAVFVFLAWRRRLTLVRKIPASKIKKSEAGH